MRLRISSVDNCDLKLNQILNKIQCLQLSGFQKKKKDYHVQKSRLREKHNTQFRSRWVGRGMSELVLTLLELMEIHGASRPCALGRGGGLLAIHLLLPEQELPPGDRLWSLGDHIPTWAAPPQACRWNSSQKQGSAVEFRNATFTLFSQTFSCQIQLLCSSVECL